MQANHYIYCKNNKVRASFEFVLIILLWSLVCAGTSSAADLKPLPDYLIFLNPLPSGYHRGLILQIERPSEGSSYIKYLEAGKESWVASDNQDVSVGDIIDFPDKKPVKNLELKPLKMVLEEVIFTPEIKIVMKNKGQLKSLEEDYLLKSNAYFETLNYEKSLKELEKAIILNPKSEPAYSQRAWQYLSMIEDISFGIEDKDLEIKKIKNQQLCRSALEDYNIAISLNPTNAWYYTRRADILSDKAICGLSQLDEAVKAYEKAVKIDDSNADYYLKLGYLYKNTNQFTKQLESANKVISLDPKSEEGYYLLGLYYEQIKDNNRALNCIKNGLMNGSSPRRGIGLLMVIVDGNKMYKEGLQIITDLIKAKPNVPEFYSARAFIHENQKSYQKAIDDYSSVLRMGLNQEYNITFYYNKRANAYNMLGKKYEALNDFKKSCEIKDEGLCKDMIPIIEADIKRGDKWQFIGQTKSDTWYYDKEKVVRSPNELMTLWIRIEITNTEIYFKNVSSDRKKESKDLSYILVREEYDCRNEKSRALNVVKYTTEGNVIDSAEDLNSQFQIVIPDSIGFSAFKVACIDEKEKRNKNKSKKR